MNADRTTHTTIQDVIDDDYKTAFKAREEKTFKPLRQVLAVIKQATIDQRKELSNDEIMAILKSEIKKRKDALEQFTKGERQDLMDEANNEITVISRYLPAAMSDKDLEEIVKITLKEIGATTLDDIGKGMGAVMKKVAGQADGTRVRDLVQKILNKA